MTCVLNVQPQIPLFGKLHCCLNVFYIRRIDHIWWIISNRAALLSSVDVAGDAGPIGIDRGTRIIPCGITSADGAT